MLYEAGFKKRGPNQIWWLRCEANSRSEAHTKLTEMASVKTGEPYLLYAGIFEVAKVGEKK